jgi:predicted transcriptional regulator
MTRRKTPRVDQTERNAAIVRLREQKVPYKVIAGHLGITVGAVNAVVRGLLKEGSLQSYCWSSRYNSRGRQRSRTDMVWERPT